jgi:hypothetical protein
MQPENSETPPKSSHNPQNDTFVAIEWNLASDGPSVLRARRWDGTELFLQAETPEQKQLLVATAKDVEKRILILKKELFG